MKRFLLVGALALSILPQVSLAASAPTTVADDVVARVGDQTISYSALNTMINSSAMVGLSLPALGTAERRTVILTLLDRMISANLLYLDALKKGTDKDPTYQRDIERFSDDVLAGLYREKYLIGDIDVTPEEVEDFYKSSIAPGTEFTDEVRTAIEATIRKNRFKARVASIRERLRTGAVAIAINEQNLDSDNDDSRDDAAVVATVGEDTITWGDVKDRMKVATQLSQQAPFYVDEPVEREKRLNKFIDSRLMALKARAVGMEQDPIYQKRVSEFRKTHLINLQRSKLVQEMQPDELELVEYFQNNRDRITFPEHRKVQTVVLKTKEDAEEIKRKIDAGEMTIYQAAMNHSIVPNARQNLGEIGWVSKGSGFPELDELTFSLEPEVLGGPVQSPDGWHLVKVLDVRDAQREDIAGENTQKATRRMLIHEKLDKYVVDLRLHEFHVEVDDKRLVRLFADEANWVAALNRKSDQKESQHQLERQIKELMEQ